MQSQAFVNHFGRRRSSSPEDAELLFDTSQVAGTNAAGERVHVRRGVRMARLHRPRDGVRPARRGARRPDLRLDVFAYDLNEPDLMQDAADAGQAGPGSPHPRQRRPCTTTRPSPSPRTSSRRCSGRPPSAGPTIERGQVRPVRARQGDDRLRRPAAAEGADRLDELLGDRVLRQLEPRPRSSTIRGWRRSTSSCSRRSGMPTCTRPRTCARTSRRRGSRSTRRRDLPVMEITFCAPLRGVRDRHPGRDRHPHRRRGPSGTAGRQRAVRGDADRRAARARSATR